MMCCKDPEIQPADTFIGKWEVVQIDSLFHVFGAGKEYWNFLATIQDTCTIELNSDSTGRFSRPFRRMIGEKTTFTWYNDLSNGRLDFYFDSLNFTTAIIGSQKTNDIELYLRDFYNGGLVGGEKYYYLKMVRN
jgi:hypothetical protein